MAFGILVSFAGCQSTEEVQKHWTNPETYSDEDQLEGIVYVSLEEWNRMTPEERSRMNAHLGWKSKVSSKEGAKNPELDERFKKMDESFKELKKNGNR